MSEEKKCKILNTETGECLDEKLKTLKKTPVEVEEPEICYIRDPNTKECLDEEWEMNIESMTEYFPELKGLPKEGAERILRETSESIIGYMKEEDKVKQWVTKFMSPKWIKEEKERIKDFEETISKVKGFSQYPMDCDRVPAYSRCIAGPSIVTPEFKNEIEGKLKERLGRQPSEKEIQDEVYIYCTDEKCPPKNPEKFEKQILTTIPLYKTEMEKYLNKAIEKWQRMKLYKKKPKDVVKLITEQFPEFWEYMNTVLVGYEDLWTTNKMYEYYDYSPIIVNIKTSIGHEWEKIDDEWEMKKIPTIIKRAREFGWY